LVLVGAAPEASAATTGGNVYAWGDNSLGELGNGTTDVQSDVPVEVNLPGGVAATAVSEGGSTSLALGSDGNVYAWGYNQYGELGDGTTTGSDVPVEVSLPGGVAAVAVSEGGGTGLALGSDGTVYAWGYNGFGQLGNGTTSRLYEPGSDVPVEVHLPGGVAAVAVSEGEYASLALGSDGNVYAWGWGWWGQLGNGTTTDSDVPVEVHLPGGVAAVAVSEGGALSLALGSDGNVYA
jgi:alpha-tubulin suppressor-like RCC1 family protein